MPKIKAYKGRNSIIPVDEAQVGVAYRCPWTNAVHGNKKSYLKHLRDFRKNRIHYNIKRKQFNKLNDELHSQTSFEDIIKWIETNNEFMFNNITQYTTKTDKLPKVEDFWVKITYLDIHWSERVSNSHNCPRNGVTNWSRRELFKDGSAKPTGYPGWTGRIEYQVSHNISHISFGSDVMKNLGIHTGTGGGISNNRYGYSVEIFEADWPGLVEYLTMERLRDGHMFKNITIGSPIYFKF